MIGGGATSPKACGEHLTGLGQGQHVEADHVGTLRSGQAGELTTASDQDQTAGARGQQRADLLLIPGIVKHN